LAGQTGVATLAARAIGFNLGLVEVLSAQNSKNAAAFSFAIITDSHLFSIPNHKFDRSLADAVAKVNGLTPAVDFVMYTGDIAQNGREDQLVKGKKILSQLKAPLHVIPGEHDWYLDMGKAWNGLFGKETWSFDHKGVHFIGLNSILVQDFWTGAGLTPLQRMSTMEMLESPIAGPSNSCARTCRSCRPVRRSSSSRIHPCGTTIPDGISRPRMPRRFGTFSASSIMWSRCMATFIRPFSTRSAT
jgi:predicted MPP superfamily phosphohydrolase